MAQTATTTSRAFCLTSEANLAMVVLAPAFSSHAFV